MNMRKRTSGGQAIVMVSLALFSMAGMMGLAVDMGWSYFTQKEAQASADGAAMAAVHEAWSRLNGSLASGVTCANSGNSLYCSPSVPPLDCGTGNASGSSNLYSGCLYAINNGFNYVTNSKIKVRMQADVGSLSGVVIGSLPKTPTGASLNIKDIAYWVTVRTAKSTPQLFSAMLGNNNGLVSAIGTAAIVAVTIPGSFYGMNQVGDCITNSSGVRFDCGVDIDLKGNGSVCANSGGVSAVLCAPNGILLASECNGSTLPAGATAGGCGAGNQNFAGMTDKTQTKAWAATYQHIAGAGAVNNVGSFVPTATNGANDTGDVFEGKVQPPILAPSSQGTCELPSSGIQGTSGNQPPLLLAPYHYYVKTGVGVSATYGAPISVTGNVKFVASGGTCPGVASGAAGSGSFPSTVFWGGVQIKNTNTTVDFTSGQYVLAGTTSTSGAVLQSGISGSPTITCSTCSGAGSPGVMFITTDGTYEPVTIGGTTYSLTKPAALSSTTFYQGYVQMKDTDAALTGIDMNATPTALVDYNHILFWQDRRNSTDTYDSTGHVITKSIDGTPPLANHVTATSPAFELDHGNVNVQLQGVIHQPRGAWLDLSSGGGAVSNSTLQIFTGAIFCDPCGNAAATLLGVTKPVTTYKTSLIQ